ncbi:MAG: hypothetical protein ABIO70_22805 [Pseudomonadota bacterium]
MRTLLCCLLLAACHHDDTGQDSAAPPDPATVPLAGGCAMAEDYGGFLVRSDDEQAGVDGAVADGVVPISVLEQIAADGDCVLLRRNNPHCDPACDPGEACDFDGTCLPWPVNQDLGTVTLTGLSAPVQMEAVFPGNTYYDTSLTAPLFEAGALVTLQMPGGAYGPATLYGVGIEPLVPLDEEWVVGGGQDLAVRWESPTEAISRGEIALSLNIDQHGASPGTLRCTFEDDGEAVVPSAIVQTLIDTGVTGFPSGALVRRTQDSAAAGAGCMDLTVSSSATVSVDVVGYTPCISDTDCPDGQDCNEELQICE